jgi:metal-responsive CopG/Arc/MetJ family transcriptional regulator
MGHLSAQIAKRNYLNQKSLQNHQKKEKNGNHQLVPSVAKNSQDHHRLNAKNVELKFISLMDHMDLTDLMALMDHHQKEENIIMDLMDHMDHHQKLNVLIVEKKLNSLITIIRKKENKRKMKF